MFLRSLKINGFKSFAEKTRITFAKGTNGIVGPNGCGKSNIVDAIKWVLGEQSARSLRGNSMEDVIFGGTAQRKGLGMAEVNLSLEIPGNREVGKRKVRVGRRLFRSGKSEYFMDGSVCRLRDINEMFLDTGIGGQAYAILEQGRVDEIIRSRPEERRAIIEEAAGIMKYKANRKETESRLQKTEENLLRLNDIFIEVKQQRTKLEVQAQRALRFKDLQEKLRQREIRLAWLEYLKLKAAVQDLEFKEQALKHAAEVAAEEVKKLESTGEQAAAEVNAARRREAELKAQTEHTRLRIEHIHDEIEAVRRRRKEDQELKDRSHEDIFNLAARKAQLEDEIRRYESQLGRTEELLVRQRKNLERLEGELATKKQDSLETEKLLDQKRRDALDLMGRVSKHKNSQVRLETELSSTQAKEQRIEREISTLKVRQTDHTEYLDELFKTLQKNEDEAEKIRGKRELLKEEITEHRNLVKGTQTKLNEAKQELTRIKSRLETLTELREQHSEFDQAYRELYAEGRREDGAFRHTGLLADVMQVDEAYLAAVEAALEDCFQGVWLASKDIESAAVFLTEKNVGRATLLPRPLRVTNVNLGPILQLDGVLGSLQDVIEVKEEYREDLAALLGHVVLFQNLAQARAAWKRFPGAAMYVTLGGEVVQADGRVRVGKGKHVVEDYLHRRREIDELQRREREVRKDVQELAELVEEQWEQLGELEKKEQNADRREGLLQAEIERMKRDLTAAESEEKRVAKVLESLDLERRQIQDDRTTFERQLKEAGTALWHAEREHDALDRELERLQEAVGSTRATHEKLTAEATEARVLVGGTAERLDGLKSGLEAAQRAFDEALNRQSRDRQLLEDLDRRLTYNIEREKALGAEIGTLEEERARLEQDVVAAAWNLKEIEGRLDQTVEIYKNARLRSDEALRTAQQASINVNAKAIALETSEQHFVEEFNLTFDQLTDEQKAPTDNMAALKLEVQDLKRDRDRLGPVNLDAIEEYREIEERYQLYHTQIEDLKDSIEKLKAAIARINQICRQRFAETFDIINRNFSEVFSRMFSGGTARMELVGSEDLLEAGIEIVAQPPGKRLQRLTLLSGGEKTLVTLSLLVAIFLHKPSPFCIMDEVDAPLDEANIARFGNLLRELSTKTQLIVITHNQHTMTVVDSLYGITMEEPGVSKVVSVALSQEADIGADEETDAA